VRKILVLVLLAVVGCDSAAPDAEPDPTPDAVAPDLTGPLFDPQRLIEVSIELPAADWDALRMQTRSVSDVFGMCPTGPHPNPFSTFRATVTVDGQRLTDVGIRKKGFYGSLDAAKPSLKIKTDEFVADQRLFGLKTLTLNNAKQDPSLIKQCLAYQVFDKAGLPSSRCNFARVRVNGNDLGIYVNVESVNKPFLRRHFASDAGNLYEGALSDFRPQWTLTFDKKTNDSDPDRSDLEEMSTALAKPDAELLAALDPLVDVEQFLDYWAAEVLIGHGDSYSGLANNFFVYDDPTTGRFNFMPWGVDNTFTAGGVINAPSSAVAANGMLARRLYLLPATRDRYVARLRQHLATIWDEPALLAEIDRMAALTGAPAAAVEDVRVFVRGRRQQITNDLAGGPPPWTAPLKNSKPCFETNGDITGTFQTTWGTLGAPDVFAAGSGTLSGTFQGATIVSQRIGSMSGLDNGRAATQLIAEHADGTFTIVYFGVDPALFVAPSDLLANAPGVAAGVFRYTPLTNTFEAVGFVLSGSLHLGAASMVDGSTVRGSFAMQTLSLPF